jgi:excisionase family DNA binding protein
MDEPLPAASLARFLTLADTAEVLNISTRQALSLIRSGELPAIKVGASGRWRIERSVLESYIEAMYEATRRMSLWNQADDLDVAEFSLERPQR